MIGPPAKAWNESFDRTVSNQHVNASAFLGELESLREAIDEDLLVPLEHLITADAFGSVLEQAEHLHDNDYDLAAGVLARAVLEEHLRNMCDLNGCLPQGRPTINDLNQALYKGQHLDKIAMKQVDAMTAVGNHCAHNLQPPLEAPDVEKLLQDVATFLAQHPLS